MSERNFAIRTITTGITLNSLGDLSKIEEAITFLKRAKKIYEEKGYEVQTIRIATNHLHSLSGDFSNEKIVELLMVIDSLTHEESIFFSVGEIAKPNEYHSKYVDLASQIISQTQNINFSTRISKFNEGIYFSSIKLAAEIMKEISIISKGGEGNFRFAAAANCQSNIPFFPVAFHQGSSGFSIGIESPNIMLDVIEEDVDWNTNKENFKAALNSSFKPIEKIADELAITYDKEFFGIDTSTAPGLNGSIAEVIERLTHQPFGSFSTLSACSLITDVIKNLDVKSCGYCGLMLPVLEDKVLALRAMNGNYTLQELLMYSAVSGIGLDVVPLPGDTPAVKIENILKDVATLSIKYESKAMSARLFLIPGKNAGQEVEFENPYLTKCKVLNIY